MICDNIGTKNGHLTFAGFDTTELAKKYGFENVLKVSENIE